MGNSHLRNVLLQITKGVVIYCEDFKRYFERKYKQFGSYKKAMIATFNKLIKVIYALLTKKHNSISEIP